MIIHAPRTGKAHLDDTRSQSGFGPDRRSVSPRARRAIAGIHPGTVQAARTGGPRRRGAWRRPVRTSPHGAGSSLPSGGRDPRDHHQRQPDQSPGSAIRTEGLKAIAARRAMAQEVPSSKMRKACPRRSPPRARPARRPVAGGEGTACLPGAEGTAASLRQGTEWCGSVNRPRSAPGGRRAPMVGARLGVCGSRHGRQRCG